MSNLPPIETLRAGAVKASIWENINQHGEPYLTVSFAKTYRDGEGRLADTNAFVGTDMLVLAHLANEAFSKTSEIRQRLISEREEPEMLEEPSEAPPPAKKTRTRRPTSRSPQ